MVNKRAWLRIVEASIAIMIVFGVLLVINSRNNFSPQQDLNSVITPLLEEIARNVTFRSDIISQGENSEPTIRGFISQRITQSTIKFDVAVCEANEICSMDNYPSEASEIYAGERIISATLTEYQPKKVKIFLWRANQ